MFICYTFPPVLFDVACGAKMLYLELRHNPTTQIYIGCNLNSRYATVMKQ